MFSFDIDFSAQNVKGPHGHIHRGFHNFTHIYEFLFYRNRTFDDDSLFQVRCLLLLLFRNLQYGNFTDLKIKNYSENWLKYLVNSCLNP